MNQIAHTILSQLGGNKFVAMTGAKNLVAGDSSLQFNIGRGARNKANKVRVTLTPADEYTVEFFRWKARALEAVTVDQVENVGAEALCRVFTSRTGLEVSL